MIKTSSKETAPKTGRLKLKPRIPRISSLAENMIPPPGSVAEASGEESEGPGILEPGQESGYRMSLLPAEQIATILK